MDSIQIAKMATSQIWQLALTWSVEDWKQELHKLSLENIHIVIPAATANFDKSQWQKKLIAAVAGLSERTLLEAVGKALNEEQILEILAAAKSQNLSFNSKLSPLLVGLSPTVFFAVVTACSPEALSILKQEALSEAIQQHLLQTIHFLSKKLTDYDKAITNEAQALKAIDLKTIRTDMIAKIHQQIDSLAQEGATSIKLATCALSIAWNTSRTDLIENLSRLNEQFRKIISHDVGHPSIDGTPATGLYESVEKKLNSVFEDIDSSSTPQALNNDTPVMDALVKFGMWYLKDYIDLGLLPPDAKGKGLDLEKGNSPTQLQAHREELFIKVNNKLAEIGLKTLADLKAAKIYSKAALIDFINPRNGS